MSDDKRARKDAELFYTDANGRRCDAELHAEILGDDNMPWDIDLDAYSKMTLEEKEAYMRRRDEILNGYDPDVYDHDPSHYGPNE